MRLPIRRGALAVTAVSVCGVAVAAAGAGAAGKVAVIKTAGGEHFAPNPASPPNQMDINTLHWAPGIITVHSGQTIKLIDGNKGGEPHVLAIAKKGDLPNNPNGSRGSNRILGLIGPQLLVNPANPQAGFKAYETNAGPNGLNQEGDSLVILPGGPHKTATWTVSAKPGTTLYYFCAVHFWMHGEIKVIK